MDAGNEVKKKDFTSSCGSCYLGDAFRSVNNVLVKVIDCNKFELQMWELSVPGNACFQSRRQNNIVRASIESRFETSCLIKLNETEEL